MAVGLEGVICILSEPISGDGERFTTWELPAAGMTGEIVVPTAAEGCPFLDAAFWSLRFCLGLVGGCIAGSDADAARVAEGFMSCAATADTKDGDCFG